ncbi:hypothetical protein AYI70_g7196 [Smittium culicis]|uniref:Uncharacterized protein n=1 Tax=Smittium culicis TaxID=133412 RepID=A0A1R1XLN9_9FUNG|nr:hypothetical protein AYI70_g7196 [Smittium culicis]
MFKTSIILVFLSVCLKSGVSQSPGQFSVRYSNNQSFSEKYQEYKNNGVCHDALGWKAMQFTVTEDSELSIFNGYGCSNLITKQDLYGTFTDRNFRSTFGIPGVFSFIINPKRINCGYHRKHHYHHHHPGQY